MKKIIFILPNLAGGGAERVVLNLLKVLDRKKFDPVLFLFSREGVYWGEVPKDIPVYWGLEKLQSKIWIIPVLYKLIKLARKADILVGSLQYTSTYMAVIAGKICGCKTIGWVHNNIFLSSEYNNSFKHRMIFQYIQKRVDRMIAVSGGVRTSLLELFPGYTADKIHTIYNPNFLDHLIDQAKQLNKINCDKPIIMGIGRLVPQKRFDLLIRAHANLIQDDVKNQLIILGEGSERGVLENLIKELGVENSVILLGFQENPYRLLVQADVFVLSSRFEGLSMVLIEALALGIPAVSMDCPFGPREVLEDGRCGLLVENGNLSELTAAIKTLLMDNSLADEFRIKGKERSKVFDAKKVIGQFEEVFSIC